MSSWSYESDIVLGEGECWIDGPGEHPNLSQIAGYLCATLYVRPPSFHLAKKHNDGKHVSDNVRWSDFWNLQFHDKETILHDLRLDPKWINKTDQYFSYFVKPYHVDFLAQQILKMYDNSTMTVLYDKESISKDFQDLDSYVSRQVNETTVQGRFVWGISANYYHWFFQELLPTLKDLSTKMNQEKANSLPQKCEYRQNGDKIPPSEFLLSVTDTIWNKLRTDFPNRKGVWTFAFTTWR